jgi:hypothetical protein
MCEYRLIKQILALSARRTMAGVVQTYRASRGRPDPNVIDKQRRIRRQRTGTNRMLKNAVYAAIWA